MRRLKWLRRVTVAVIVAVLSAALGFALKRGTEGDPSSGGSLHGHPADLERVPSDVESEYRDGLESQHGDEAESAHEDEAAPEREHEEDRH